MARKLMAPGVVDPPYAEHHSHKLIDVDHDAPLQRRAPGGLTHLPL
jgi:hypothetical protein